MLCPLEQPFANRPREMLGQRADVFSWQEVLRTYINGRLSGSERENLRRYHSFILRAGLQRTHDSVASDEDGDILQGSHSAHTYPTRCICALWAAWMNWKYHIARVLLYSESISSLIVGEFLSNNGIPSGIWVEGEWASWRRLGAKEKWQKEHERSKIWRT